MIDDAKDLGQSLVHRASAPGVIRRDLAVRRSFHGGAWLADEIHRRYAPAAPPPVWGHGPGLPYNGFGSGATSSAISVTGKAIGSPGIDLATGPGGDVLQKAAPGAKAGSAIVRRSTARPHPPGPPLPSTSPRPGEGGKLENKLPQRQGGGAPLPEGWPQAGVAMGEGTRVRSADMQPAIVHHSADRSAVQRTSLKSARSEPVQAQRSDIPRSEVGAADPPLPLAQSARLQPEAPSTAALAHSPAPPLPSPSREGGGAPLPVEGRSMGEGTGVRSVDMQPAIVHRSADRSAVQRTSLKSAKSEPVQAQRSTISRSEVGAAELHTLPLTQPARLQPKAPAAETGIDLPLARSAQPGGVIQRQPAENLSHFTSPQAIELDDEGFPANDEAAAPGSTTAAPGLDLEDVVDRVMRRLTRTLAVESERHGGRRWNN